MFGCYRLVLAVLVALSHFGLVVDGFNPGQWAVVGFYVLSGFLMSRQFHKLAPQGGWGAFYLDRALRILPLFWFVTCATLFLAPLSGTDLALNLSLFPLNYSSFLHIPSAIPPAWSLACEAHFYGLVPFLALAPTRVLYALLAASLCLFCGSIFLPDDAFWAYTGLPGILFTFLSGILLDRHEDRWLRRFVLPVMGILLALFLAGKLAKVGYKTGIHINVAIGYLCAIPVTIRLMRLSPRVKWDQAVGLLSYPLFLAHGPVRLACSTYFPRLGPGVTLLIALIVSAALVVGVEKPFDHLRYWARGRMKTSSGDRA